MQLLDEVRSTCREIAANARSVSIDLDAAREPPPAPPRAAPQGDADFLLQLDAINFGSGWFPTLRKRQGLSGYRTIEAAFTERGPWSNAELRELDPAAVAAALGQEPSHPLMRLYAQALRDLGRFLGGRSTLDVVEEAGDSAERLAVLLARGMRFFDDRGFYKRAQIVPSDLALAGAASFDDLDRLTIFADNLVPHVLRVDGVLRYDPELAAHIDAELLLPQGQAEREIRACAVHACEQLAERFGITARELDMRLWNAGQAPAYKAVPRHRTRGVYY
ncbi:MAG TPA: queuosine salvage family protein [Thermoleophilaceae bacterium]|nr:queuosine salvage family protein [Thermoleophilaceae bacterium]